MDTKQLTYLGKCALQMQTETTRLKKDIPLTILTGWRS